MWQFIRYVAVGVFNTLFGYMIIFGCMYLLNMSPELSNMAGYAVGVIVSYSLNRRFTFNSTQERRKEILRFLAVFGVAYTLNFLTLLVLLHQLHVNEAISQIVAGVVYVAVGFLMNKYYVFKIRHG
jgi:putative flippase GtrA